MISARKTGRHITRPSFYTSIGLKMNYSFLTHHFTTPQNHGRGMYMPSKKELMVLERKRGEFSER